MSERDVVLKIEDLSKTFAGGRSWLGRRRATVTAVDGVSFALRRGETLGLVGESGSGKSTLGRMVLRLVDPSGGRVWFEGEDITALSQRRVRQLRRRIQMVFQDPYGPLDPRMSVGALVAEPLVVHGLWRGDGAQRVAETLRRVGLDPDHVGRYPHEFSGGQRQRIGIARAIMANPSLLVLDEPVSALDVSIQAQIINLLRDLQRVADLAFLFIAHDLAVVRHVSHRVAVMYLGRIIELAPRDALYRAPLHPYTVSLLSAVPVPDPGRERRRSRVLLHGEIGSATALPSGCRFHPRCYKARLLAGRPGVATVARAGQSLPARCVEQVPALVDDGQGHHVACHFPERGAEQSPVAAAALAALS
jgi:oligopeptide/dipeptide ABC transporter ATP-binding protein